MEKYLESRFVVIMFVLLLASIALYYERITGTQWTSLAAAAMALYPVSEGVMKWLADRNADAG